MHRNFEKKNLETLNVPKNAVPLFSNTLVLALKLISEGDTPQL